jgi:hypothetical protein
LCTVVFCYYKSQQWLHQSDFLKSFLWFC